MSKVDQIDPDEDAGPSKSELKRQMSERQKLAETLAGFSSESLKTVPIEDGLRSALLETAKIKTFGGIRRHKQYLGKLMRLLTDDEIQGIKKQIEIIEGPGRVETAHLHRMERLRERLLSNDEVLTELIAQHPSLDVQNLRTLIRNARKEKESNKPPKAYGEIFQVLRELYTQTHELQTIARWTLCAGTGNFIDRFVLWAKGSIGVANQGQSNLMVDWSNSLLLGYCHRNLGGNLTRT